MTGAHDIGGSDLDFIHSTSILALGSLRGAAWPRNLVLLQVLVLVFARVDVPRGLHMCK